MWPVSLVQTWEDVRWLLLQRRRWDDVRVEVINERHEVSFRRLDLGGRSGSPAGTATRLAAWVTSPGVPAVIGRSLPGR